MEREITIYCRNRITNRGEQIGLVDTVEDIEIVINDYLLSMDREVGTIETTFGSTGCLVHRIENIADLIFISREELSKYDFY